MIDHNAPGAEHFPAPIPGRHVRNLVTPLTVAKGRLQLVRRYLLDPNGSQIDAALRSLDAAEGQIDDTAQVISMHADRDDGCNCAPDGRLSHFPPHSPGPETTP